MRAWSVLWKLTDPAGSSLLCSTREENLGGRLLSRQPVACVWGASLVPLVMGFFNGTVFLQLVVVFAGGVVPHTARQGGALHSRCLVVPGGLADLQHLVDFPCTPHTMSLCPTGDCATGCGIEWTSLG